MDCQMTTMRHTPRSDQPVLGLPRLRASCDKRLKHTMRRGYTTDDVSYWCEDPVLVFSPKNLW